MAATAIALHLKPKIRLVSNPKFSLLYSSSSSSSSSNFNEEPQDGHTSAEFQSHPDSSSSTSSTDFKTIRAYLIRLQSPQQQFHISSSSGSSSPDTSKLAIHNNNFISPHALEQMRSDLNTIKAKLRLQSPQQQFHISSSSTPSSPDTSKFDHSLESEPLSYMKSYDQFLKDNKWIEEQVKDKTSWFNTLPENSKQISKDRDIDTVSSVIRLANKFRMEGMKKKKNKKNLKKKLKLTERLANPKEMEQKESDESIVGGSFFKDIEGKP